MVGKRQEHNELLLRFCIIWKRKLQKGISGSISDFLDNYLRHKNETLEKLSKEEQNEEIKNIDNKLTLLLVL